MLNNIRLKYFIVLLLIVLYVVFLNISFSNSSDRVFYNSSDKLWAHRVLNTNDANMGKLFTAISASIEAGDTFRLNSQETLASDFYFVRAQNANFNYSSNPSFVSGSTGQLLWPSMQNNPQTFITTVGLYNDSNELCAVAKLSRPLVKDFTKELLVRVKLDY